MEDIKVKVNITNFIDILFYYLSTIYLDFFYSVKTFKVRLFIVQMT